ncbi:Formation of crista junctions protein 1 [Borealophlyctis nickersoniae]|nr:Formation of crista junctions protein 1 [Borealophlyctis nickersoniae]
MWRAGSVVKGASAPAVRPRCTAGVSVHGVSSSSLQLGHVRTFATTNTSKPFPLVKYTFTFLILAGGSYAGAGYYALHDPSFRKIWVENIPGGQEALDQIAIAADKAKKTSLNDVQQQASRTVETVEKTAVELKEKAAQTVGTVEKTAVELREKAAQQYDSALKTVEGAKEGAVKTYENASKTAKEMQAVAEEKVANVRDFVGNIQTGAIQTYEQAHAKVKQTEASLREFASNVERTLEDARDKVEEQYESVKSIFTGQPPPPRKVKDRVLDAAKDVKGEVKDIAEVSAAKVHTTANKAAVKTKVEEEKIRADVGEAASKMKGVVSGAADKAKEVGEKAAGGVKEAGEKAVAGAKAAAEKIGEKAHDVSSKAKTQAARSSAVVQDALQEAKGVPDKVQQGVEKVTAVAQKAAAAASAEVAVATHKAKTTAETVKAETENVAAKVSDKASEQVKHVKSGAEKVKDTVRDAVEEVKEEVEVAKSRRAAKVAVLETPDTVATGEDTAEFVHALVNLDAILKTLPNRPASRDLAHSIDTLAFTINDLVSTASVEEKPKLEKARNELMGVTRYLNALEADEAELIKSALHKQATKFADILKSHVESTEIALAEQAKDMDREFGKMVAEEREKLLAAHHQDLANKLSHQASEFRAALDTELRKQAEELQRHWEKQVKTRVDQERDGRLARLDHLALKLKYLEKSSIDAGEALDKSYKVHRLWSALKAVNDALDRPYQVSFAKELSILKELADGFPVVETVIAVVPPDVARTGIPTLFDLERRFADVSTSVRRAQLMSSEGGPVSYGLSYLLSHLLFAKKGLVAGSDVESVLARSEFYLKEGDLENAARELNQLKGWPKTLARDWLVLARQHLEVKQALEVVEKHLGLLSLGVV